MPTERLIPAAQYLRMSTEFQYYSIENQKAAIGNYAKLHRFQIIQTYEDPGKSGLDLQHRDGLRALLADVVKGNSEYKAIIVYDVSRWGRFQDADEAAHYEFVCKRAGIAVHYCAETFCNDGTLPSYFAKVLKRTMAAEYSRELSIKSFENQKKLVQLGFRMGSEPGFGFRRMAVSSAGKYKGLLKTGECKILMTDRVILVPGPKQEVRCVQQIYAMCARQGMGCTEIARVLNQKRIKNGGKNWDRNTIRKLLTNPKYAGWSVWNRTTKRLNTSPRPLAPEHWIWKANAYGAIVSQSTFDRAQKTLRENREGWSYDELLQELRLLLARKGRLSERLIARNKGMPAVATYYKRLGTFQRIYKLIGYRPPSGHFDRCVARQNTSALRKSLFAQIATLFPGKTELFRLPGKVRSILRLGDCVVSLVLCPAYQRPDRQMHWTLNPVPSESKYVTLLCRLNPTNDSVHSFHLFSGIDKLHRCCFTARHLWLLQGERLDRLEDLPRLCSAMAQRFQHKVPELRAYS